MFTLLRKLAAVPGVSHPAAAPSEFEEHANGVLQKGDELMARLQSAGEGAVRTPLPPPAPHTHPRSPRLRRLP